MTSFSPFFAMAWLFTSLAFASGTCTSEYYSSPVFGASKQCAPSGFYDSPTFATISTQALLTQKCDDTCSSNSTCVGYIATLSNVGGSSRTQGRCYYYATFPTLPLSCSGSPAKIWGRLRDPTNQCLTRSPLAASRYCSALVGASGGSRAGVPSTSTTTSTVIVTPDTVTVVVAAPPVTAMAATQTTTTCITPTLVTNGRQRRRGQTQNGLGAAVLEDRAAAVSPAPACLRAGLLPASKIASACSCLGVTKPAQLSPTTIATTTATITVTQGTTARVEVVVAPSIITVTPIATFNQATPTFALRVRTPGDTRPIHELPALGFGQGTFSNDVFLYRPDTSAAPPGDRPVSFLVEPGTGRLLYRLGDQVRVPVGPEATSYHNNPASPTYSRLRDVLGYETGGRELDFKKQLERCTIDDVTAALVCDTFFLSRIRFGRGATPFDGVLVIDVNDGDRVDLVADISGYNC